MRIQICKEKNECTIISEVPANTIKMIHLPMKIQIHQKIKFIPPNTVTCATKDVFKMKRHKYKYIQKYTPSSTVAGAPQVQQRRQASSASSRGKNLSRGYSPNLKIYNLTPNDQKINIQIILAAVIFKNHQSQRRKHIN